MEEKTQHLYGFGPFCLDAREYLLMLDGKPVPLPPKAFEALLMLVENAGHLVDKNELMKQLWPDTFVEDGNVAKHVSLLRRTLSEATNGEEYIETVPKRGYRFVAEVRELASAGVEFKSHVPVKTSHTRMTSGDTAGFEESTAPATEQERNSKYQREDEISLDFKPLKRDQPKRHTRWLIAGPITLSLLIVAASVLWFATHQTSSQPEIKFRQLTASSSDDPIRYGAISPDGKYLAYADLKGIHIMLIKTGEAQTVPPPEVFRGNRIDWQLFRWFPDGTRFLVNQNPPDERANGYSATIWSVPVIGGPPRKLRQDAGVESISPDGSLVAFTTDTRNVWLMGPNGEQVRKLHSSAADHEIWNFRFSPNGERLMYTEYPDGTLKNRELNGGNPVKMLSGTTNRLRDYLWLPSGRVVYALSEPSPNDNTCNLWELRVDVHTGRPQGTPRRLTNWWGCAPRI